jgi:hypothetical protein
MKTKAQERLDKKRQERGLLELERNSQCPSCGKFFHYLGLANHRASCVNKRRPKDDLVYQTKDEQP